MGADPLAFVESLHRGRGQPYIEPLSKQRKRYAVVAVIYLDVIVDIDPGLDPFCVFIGLLTYL